MSLQLIPSEGIWVHVDSFSKQSVPNWELLSCKSTYGDYSFLLVPKECPEFKDNRTWELLYRT